MEQTKRQLNDSLSDDDRKRRKKQTTANESTCSSRQSLSCLEDLSNELIYEIFDFLNYFHVYEAFFDLNIRFRNLLTHSNLPIKIHLSSLSKPIWTRFNTDIIQTNIARISTFHISDPFMCNLVLLSRGKILAFDRLENLILNNIESECLENLLNQLLSLSLLSSLIITTVDCISNQNSIYRQIFRLPALKYCKLSLLVWDNHESLPVSTDKCSSIEHLIITHSIGHHQLDSLLSYVPQLRRLSLRLKQNTWQHRISRCPFFLNQLTNIDLELDDVQFNVFEEIMRKLFSMIEVFHLTLTGSTPTDSAYMNASGWEQLITSHLPHLQIFDIQYDVSVDIDQLTTENQINAFRSSFWFTRQWFFSHKFYNERLGRRVLFYSTNPYRRKHYALYEQSDENTSSDLYSSNLNSVRQIHIRNEKSITNCTHSFPNATELILKIGFSSSCPSIALLLDRIVPLKQLTKLVIECYHFSFKKMIDLLYFAPHIRILIFQCMPLHKDDSIEQSKPFRTISDINTITHITFQGKCTLEKVRLLVALCPRVQYLSIQTLAKTAEPIIRFLLDKTNPNTRRLSSLCFTRAGQSWLERVDKFVQSETLLDDYTLKRAGFKLYLWW